MTGRRLQAGEKCKLRCNKEIFYLKQSVFHAIVIGKQIILINIFYIFQICGSLPYHVGGRVDSQTRCYLLVSPLKYSDSIPALKLNTHQIEKREKMRRQGMV